MASEPSDTGKGSRPLNEHRKFHRMMSHASIKELTLNVEHPDWARAVASADQFLIATGRKNISSLLAKTWAESGADGLGRTAIAMILEIWKTCPAEYRTAGSPSVELLSRKFPDHTAFSLATATVLGGGSNFLTPQDLSDAERALTLIDSASSVLKCIWGLMSDGDAISVATTAIGDFERLPDPGLFLALIVVCVASAQVMRDHAN